MLTPDIGSSLPVHQPYGADWAQPFTGTWDAWLALRDIHGLDEAITALYRIQARGHSRFTLDQLAMRNNHLELARQILTAERELLLREMHKRLGEIL